MSTPRLALFDMDRTLLEKETATLYVKHQREIGEAGMRDLLRTLGWVAQYTLGVIDANKVAERALRSYEGTPEIAMSIRCDDWFRRSVERFVADAGRRAVAEHASRGDECAIVTGATLYVARPLARLLSIPFVVSSELEIDDAGCFTGRPVHPLCFGRGKLERAERFAKARGKSLDDAIFYSDSLTDLPLLERVGEPVCVNPDPRLARVAKRRGWRVERW